MSLIFLDLETTGLVPETCEILEIAMLEVDPVHFTPLRGVSTPIRHIAPQLDMSKIDPYVQDMHTKNGLFAELASAPTFAQVYTAVREWLGPGLHTMAGDSVHFDREFLRHHMPNVHALFSHRLLDTSAFMVGRQLRGLEPCPVIGSREHRAAGDVEASLAKARWHLGRLAA